MKDCVFIEGLTVITTIGVYEWEKSIKQKLVLDIEMEWDNRFAGISDDVKDCLDYSKVTEYIIDHLTNNRFELIEKVAEDIAQEIITQFNVPRIKVKVSKPDAIAMAKNVAVMIERFKI